LPFLSAVSNYTYRPLEGCVYNSERTFGKLVCTGNHRAVVINLLGPTQTFVPCS